MNSSLQVFHDNLKSLRRSLKTYNQDQVAKKQFRQDAERYGSQWFSDLLPKLAGRFPPEVLEKYSSACARLIKLSSPNNLKKSYIETLDAIIKPLRDEIIIPIKSGTATPQTLFAAFVAKLSDPGESAYFQESIDCAKHGYLRAAAVLGWCAAIDRIHSVIEKRGFSTFNVTSAQMASQQKGRFKKFNQTQNVTSLSDLREVFDTVVMWIIEGMGLIDSNQHTRLWSCFELRCHCSHPGEAPITEYNLMSFFSDLQQIVLENPTFDLGPVDTRGKLT
jgi:hypothetical protein